MDIELGPVLRLCLMGSLPRIVTLRTLLLSAVRTAQNLIFKIWNAEFMGMFTGGKFTGLVVVSQGIGFYPRVRPDYAGDRLFGELWLGNIGRRMILTNFLNLPIGDDPQRLRKFRVDRQVAGMFD
jgi:hypothetical protein